jgi:ribosomal small subunit protein bTHX
MGRGDKKTAKGKIFRKSTGKSRPKPKAIRKKKELKRKLQETQPAEPKA